jgi:hypothetical protein
LATVSSFFALAGVGVPEVKPLMALSKSLRVLVLSFFHWTPWSLQLPEAAVVPPPEDEPPPEEVPPPDEAPPQAARASAAAHAARVIFTVCMVVTRMGSPRGFR